MADLSAVEVSVSPVARFREYLATKGMRLTTERENIVSEVFSSHEHFDAEQLVFRLAQRSDGRNVSRSTVYRALIQMVEAGLLRKVARTNDREIFEHDYGYPQHDHLICKKCGDLIEFHNVELAEILERISREHGFRMDAHRLEVHGTCATCSRPQRAHRKLDMI